MDDMLCIRTKADIYSLMIAILSTVHFFGHQGLPLHGTSWMMMLKEAHRATATSCNSFSC